MPSTHSSEVRKLRRQIATLQLRVSSIERALRPKGKASKKAAPRPQLDRQHAEWTARNEAMQEFWKQREIDRYRQSPHLLKVAKEQERSINTFLRDRGIKPEKSELSRVVKLLTQEAKSKSAETARGKEQRATNSASKDDR